VNTAPPRPQIEAGDVSGLAVGPKRQAEEVARGVVAGEAAHGQGVLAGHQRQAIVVGVGPRDIAGRVNIRDPSNAQRLVHREPANLIALGARQLRQCAGAQPGGDGHGRGVDSLAVAEDHRIGSDTCDAGAGSRLDAGGRQGLLDEGARVVAEIAADDVGSIDQYDPRRRGRRLARMDRDAASHLGGELDAGEATADDDECVVARASGGRRHRSKAAGEGESGVVGVDVPGVLG